MQINPFVPMHDGSSGGAHMRFETPWHPLSIFTKSHFHEPVKPVNGSATGSLGSPFSHMI